MKLNHTPESPVPSVSKNTKEPIFTRNFFSAAFATFSTFGSFQILMAAMPFYIVTVGGKESDVGVVMGIFAITALLTRPFAGQAADIWGRKKVMMIGGIGMALMPLPYIFIGSIPPLIGLRLLQGMAFGIASTAASALAADAAPPQRRGEAMGFFGMSHNLSMAIGPALGIVIMNSLGFTNLFLISASVGLMAFVCSLIVREPPRRPIILSKRPPLIVGPAIFPSSILYCFSITYGSVNTFVPLYAIDRGMSNPGLFFAVQATVMFFLRSYAGQLSDRFGRGAVLIPGLIMTSISLVLLSGASSLFVFLGVAVLYAAAMVSVQTSLMALIIDRVKPEMRGAGMGTYMSAMDAGIGSGAILWGFVAGLWGFSRMYILTSFMPLLGIGLFLWINHRNKQKRLDNLELSH